MSDFERHETWRPGIKITDLKPGDIIYIQKTVADHSYMYECEFISFIKGVVTGKVIRCEQIYAKHNSDEKITARLTKCYLWGKLPEERWEYCHWFKRDGEAR